MTSGDGRSLPYFVKDADEVHDGTEERLDENHEYYDLLVASNPELRGISPIVATSTDKATIRAISYRVGDVLYYK